MSRRRSARALLRQKCERMLRVLNREGATPAAVLDEVCCLEAACQQVRDEMSEAKESNDRQEHAGP